MERYYFDIDDGTGRVRDREGLELDSFDKARRTAIQELGLIFRDELPDGNRANFVVTVRDGGGIPVFVAAAQVFGEDLT